MGTTRRVHKAELDELASQPNEIPQLIIDLEKNAFNKAMITLNSSPKRYADWNINEPGSKES